MAELETVIDIDPPYRKPKPFRPKPNQQSKVDVGKALELRWKGLSFEDIGAMFGVTGPAVCQRLKSFASIVKDSSLPNLFDNQALGLLKSVHINSLLAMARKLDDRKSSVNNLAYANKQLFDQIRLLEGKSTSNISSLTRVIMEAHKAADKPVLDVTNDSANVP